ncbi:MAG TPA: ATP-binding cassette domain-containing protein [Rhodospirillales bacterium]|nr:ATP-binding cassette domain-containing protein [Flavobacteriales bacterium]HIN75379.1 ATP-binding cassette domain-containing protein [Rhodospirillales bacterium]
MSSEIAIATRSLSKAYRIYRHPADRLKQFFAKDKRQYYQEFHALTDINITIKKGEVIGIIGRNGAGKSTLLQLICGTLQATGGTLVINGRIAALLELGAGFNLEFTGRENIFLAAAIQGIPEQKTHSQLDGIIAFSGIAPFIDQPVRTYSSGMYVRLAFSVAISVDPDILVIDEALSVGDAEFSRKSFDRIMALKDAGKTILFCSHSLYQIEALCTQAIWLDQGRIIKQGGSSDVIVAYNQSLAEKNHNSGGAWQPQSEPTTPTRFSNISCCVNGQAQQRLKLHSQQDDLEITLSFDSDPTKPGPSVAVVITDYNDKNITSAGTANENRSIARKENGSGVVSVIFPRLSILKGNYWVHCYLMCDRGIHFYEHAAMVAELEVRQSGLELGVVSLPHAWSNS